MDSFLRQLGASLQDWWEALDLFERAPRLLLALLILLIGWYLARVLGGLARRGLRRRAADPEISLLIARLVHWGLLVLVVLMAAQEIGLDISAFLAGLGILGFTLGFALQDASKNFIAGILLLLQQPFELGDTIEIGGFTGTVLEINLRDTEIRTVDGLRARIPNGDVFTSPVLNYTGALHRRLQISFGVAYSSSLAEIQDAVLEALKTVPGVLEEPAIDFRFEAFGDTGIRANILYWYNEAETSYSRALDGGIQAIQKALRELNVEIPLAPQALSTRPPIE